MARTPRLSARGAALVLIVDLWLCSGCTMFVRLPDISIALSLFGVPIAASGAELHVGDSLDGTAENSAGPGVNP